MTTIFTDDRYTKRDKRCVHNLEAILSNVKLNDQIYVLVGVVNYINSSGNVDSGHYITYARCGSRYYEYDDLKKHC